MVQLEGLHAFVQIAEHESTGKAAAAASNAKSAMSRKLGLLEERLQTELIAKTTRYLCNVPDHAIPIDTNPSTARFHCHLAINKLNNSGIKFERISLG